MALKKLSVLSCLALAATLCIADPVDDIIDRAMKAQNVPGLSLLVIKDGKVVKRTAYGLMDTQSKRPATPETVYETGSIGKTFTATLVMQLVGEGKIKLDAPISTYLKTHSPTWKDITVKHLLTHQSGLPEYVLIPGVGLADTYTTEDFFKAILNLPLDFQPGAMHQYSNTNFALLGHIVESVTGRKYKDVVADRILKPAGMKSTSVIEPDRNYANLATGYMAGQGGTLTSNLKTTTSGTGADGMFVSNVDDLAKFIEAVLAGKLVPLSTLKQMQTGATTNSGRRAGYGFGWFTRNINGKRHVSHGGNSVGFSASMSTFPESGLVITLMCNFYPVGGDNLARQIAEVYDPSLSLNNLPEAGSDPHPKLTKWLLMGGKALAAGQFEDMTLDQDLKNIMKTGRGNMMRGSFAPFRDITELRYIRTEDDAPDRVIRYRGIAGNRKFAVVFVVSKDNKIVSTGLRAES